MTWKDVGNFVSKAAPLVGNLLLGNVGGTVGTLIASILGTEDKPDQVLEVLKNNPEAILKIKEIESNERVQLQRLFLESKTAELVEETRQIQSINETMRIEATTQNKWSAFWRPYWGVVSGTAFGIVSMFICYLAYKAVIGNEPEALNMIPTLISSMAMLFGIPMTILGVTAWHRGKMQRIQAGEKLID